MVMDTAVAAPVSGSLSPSAGAQILLITSRRASTADTSASSQGEFCAEQRPQGDDGAGRCRSQSALEMFAATVMPGSRLSRAWWCRPALRGVFAMAAMCWELVAATGQAQD